MSGLHAVSLYATAGEGNPREVGREYRVLLLLKAGSSEDAQTKALAALHRNAWSNGRLLRDDPVTADLDDEPEGYLRDAMIDAMEGGVAFVVYDQ
ncbi:MAG TPA: hypothetical protein VGE05_07060 [Novosphingobium sp.]